MKKIALVGTSPSCIYDAPFNDESWQIWSLSGCYKVVPRHDVWFELHSEKEIFADMPPDYIEFCKQAGGGLLTFERIAAFPDAQLFPRDAIINRFGSYLTSSVAWMMALAIHIEADEIGLWGIDMVGEENEYHRQRACCEYFIGLARGMGIKVTVPEKSALLKGGIYPGELMLNINSRLKSAIAAREKALAECNYTKGQVDLLKDLQIELA